MNISRAKMLFAMATFALVMMTGKADAAFETTVPVSAELGTSIAGNLFPVTVKLSNGSLFLTDPYLLFIDNKRIAIRVRFQAYDHRPAQSIAISETGIALLSGRVGYDPDARQILLHDPTMDSFEFDHDSDVTQRFLAEVNALWVAQVTNPIRSEIPPHAYIYPFRDYIQDVSYNGKNINLKILYE
ncbi:MAG: hypothetical protein V7700_02830 [Halioglobus sp.]